MRFVTFRHASGVRCGVIDGDVIHAFAPGVRLIDLLDAGGLRLREEGDVVLRSSQLTLPLGAVELCAPLPRPVTIRDYMTFEQHVEGVAKLLAPDGDVPEYWYEAPAFYFSNPNSIHGPFQDVAIPPGCARFDLELEVAAVLGGRGRDVSADEADRLIAGFVLLNDWSARDLQFREMTVRLGPAKGKDAATSLGPWLITSDELEPLRRRTSYDITLTASINGETIGSDNLSNMSFSFGQMIAYASRGTDVGAGELFGSGTSGSGCLAELWGRQGTDFRPSLLEGDVVAIEGGLLGRQVAQIVKGSQGRNFSEYHAVSARG
jgi:2-keto-4-pentenoate hydratase/2-oxohepta-3-ene-1,7-dioic acid hydratase in catechol pathway